MMNIRILSFIGSIIFCTASCGNRNIDFVDRSGEALDEPSAEQAETLERSGVESKDQIAAQDSDSQAVQAAESEDVVTEDEETVIEGDTIDHGVASETMETSGDQDKGNRIESGTAATVPDAPAPVLADQAKQPSVSEICKSLPLKKKTVDIFFGAKTKECLWSKGDNLSKVDGIVRARSEEKIKLQLSDKETICGMSFTSPEQTIKFDDELILTFNDSIVMSSYNYNPRFQSTSGLPKYNWLELIDGYNPGVYQRGVPFCLGVPGADKQNCVVPPSQASGRLYLALPEESAQKLSASVVSEKRAEIGLIVTGDNDKVDCQYSDISFKIEMLVVERL